MQKPISSEHETERLQALYALQLLDTPKEERYDRLTRLAQCMFNVPIAVISLVDTDRQWFKSQQGLTVCETGRDVSFCGHAILQPDIFEVPDTLLDARFADNPMVLSGPKIRFYAGVPLVSGGYNMGMLCIKDIQPRKLNVQQKQALQDLAQLVTAEFHSIELHKANVALVNAQQLSEVISRAQEKFIAETDRRRAFDELLADILKLTASEYGFIGEVLHTDQGAPYLKTFAITNIAWNDATRAFYTANAPKGMEFFNLETLFGAALTSGKPVISAKPDQDPRRGGLPEGHPPMHAFLGLPIHYGGKLVALIGLANRADGYDQALIEFLLPLRVTLGQLVVAAQLQLRYADDQKIIRRLSRVASQTTNGVVITDVEGKVQWINEGFSRVSGFCLDELIGRKPGELLQGPSTDTNVVATMSLALAKKEPFVVEIINYHRDGTQYWIEINCSPLYDEENVLIGFLAIQADISERKQLDIIKWQFISTVSHELRTPLTAICGALDLVASGQLGALNTTTAKMIVLARNNSQRLKFLINDLLDLEKITHGKLEFNLQLQPLQPLLQQAIDSHETYSSAQDVHIEQLGVIPEVMVHVDEQRLAQVLANLLSNAIKFSQDKSTIKLTVQTILEMVRVSVIDQGQGIPDAFKAHIFERFSQADSSDSRMVAGTGLGLAICRELIERMDGRIGFDSIEGQGATFWFELPQHQQGGFDA